MSHALGPRSGRLHWGPLPSAFVHLTETPPCARPPTLRTRAVPLVTPCGGGRGAQGAAFDRLDPSFGRGMGRAAVAGVGADRMSGESGPALACTTGSARIRPHAIDPSLADDVVMTRSAVTLAAWGVDSRDGKRSTTSDRSGLSYGESEEPILRNHRDGVRASGISGWGPGVSRGKPSSGSELTVRRDDPAISATPTSVGRDEESRVFLAPDSEARSGTGTGEARPRARRPVSRTLLQRQRPCPDSTRKCACAWISGSGSRRSTRAAVGPALEAAPIR